MNEIIKDIIKFESYYLYSNENNNKIYDNIIKEDKNDTILNIFYTIKKNKKKIIKSILNDHFMQTLNEKISMQQIKTSFLKNNEDLFIAYIAVILLISISSNANKSISSSNFKLNTISYCCNSFEYIFKKIEIIFLLKMEIKIPKININEITKIFNLLILDNIIQEKNIWTSKNKTTKFIYIKNMTNIFINEVYTTNFKHLKYENNFWLYNETFWSFKEIFKKNNYSNEKFNLNDEKLISNLCENYFYIDIDNVEKIYNIFIEKENINRVSLYEDYKISIEQYTENIKSKEISSLLSKKISKYLKCFIFENILKNYNSNTKYYLPFIMDFRGRKYDMTDISPTFFMELRYCIHLGEYDFNKDIKIHPLKEKIDNIILKKENLIKDIFKSEEKNKKIAFIWLLISLAEPFKNKIGDIVSLEKFILKGLEILNNQYITKTMEYDDRIKCEYIIKIIEEIKKDVWIKRLIPKDATASVFQHLVKCLGENNENSLKYCNMNSEENWYDTYSLIIKEFNKKIKIKKLSNEEYHEIFNRKSLKKTTMTKLYGCGLKKALEYFNEATENIVKKHNDEKKNEIKEIFIEFYNHLSKKNTITKENISKIIDFFEKDKKIVFNDKSETNYVYFKTKKERIDSTINNKRYTRIFETISKEENIYKYKISIVANYIQSMDASLVRWVLGKIIIITIHDCFMIDYMNISYLIALINEGMNIKFHSILNIKINEIFSIFIVI